MLQQLLLSVTKKKLLLLTICNKKETIITYVMIKIIEQ